LILLILIAIIVGIKIKNRNSIKQNNQVSNAKDSGSVLIKDTIPIWKTYDNNLGITFKYPKTWTNYGDESKILDRTGKVMTVIVNLIDTITQSTLLIKYHLAPYGEEVYKSALAKYNSSKDLYEKARKQLEINGNKAIEGTITMLVDGKDHKLTPPLRVIVVDFLDKQKTGEIELQFKTPLTDDGLEVSKFDKLLTTFKFTN